MLTAGLLVSGLVGGACRPKASQSLVAEAPGRREDDRLPALVALAAPEQHRVLRGDWESPSTLLVAYEGAWSQVLADLVSVAKQRVSVVVLLKPADANTQDVRQWLELLDVRSLEYDFDTPWVRDYGPFELLDEQGARLWLDMEYSTERPSDDLLPQALSHAAGMPVERPGVELDGGGVISNGEGHCVMTQASYFPFAGNVPAERAGELVDQLGCQILTITPALPQEPTGHIDMIAQFLAPDVVVVGTVDRSQYPDDAQVLDRTAELLLENAEYLNQRMRVIRVPLVVRGDRYYSYVNGTRLRSGYLVPAYAGVPERVERQAYRQLRRGLPRHVDLLPVFADDLVASGGAVHCVTLGVGDTIATSSAVLE